MKFGYYVPTRMVVGRGCVRESASLFSGFGRRALIVTGKRSAKACGALDDVLRALEANGQSAECFDGVEPNPSVASVYAGARLARECGADFVVAVGGGSPMDAAKAVALLAVQEIPEEKLFGNDFGPEVLPMVHIPTTAGTGSEVTQYAVLTNDREQTKKSISGPMLFPKIAFLDGQYLRSVSRTTALNTAVDAVSHAAEGMLSLRAGEISDLLARESLTRIGSRLRRIAEGKCGDGDLDELLLASSLAGMVIANTGTTTVHAMGYPLTYFKGIDHGRANGLVLGEFLRWIERRDARSAAAVTAPLGVENASALTAELRFLLGAPEVLTEEEIARYSARSAQNKNVRNCRYAASEREIREIYCRSFLS